MTEVRRWRVGLVVLGGVLLAACGNQEDSSLADASFTQPATGIPGGAGASTAGGGGTPIFPGTMSPLPDASVFAPMDASVFAPRDGSVFAPRDASLTRDAGVPTSDGASPMTPPGGSVDLSSCAPPPMGVSAAAMDAWTMLNQIRLAAGAGCMNMVPALNTSAQSHCDYRATNRSNTSCAADAHSEISGCPGFTGVDVQSREIAAGYPRTLAYTEVALTYGNMPKVAIPAWLVTPFHRIPMIDPWTTDMGWGGGPGCDVIDLGRGMVHPPDSTVVVYPHDGMIDVPTSFNGLEAPQPPPPASGWPSSYPISIYAQRINVTEHALTKDGDPTPLDHMFLDTKNPGVASLRNYFPNNALLYGAAFAVNTKYRVKMVGTYAGGALNVEWTFTTSAKPPSRF